MEPVSNTNVMKIKSSGSADNKGTEGAVRLGHRFLSVQIHWPGSGKKILESLYKSYVNSWISRLWDISFGIQT